MENIRQPEGIKQRVEKLLNQLMDDTENDDERFDQLINGIADYGKEMRQKYSTADQTRAFNKLIGSSLMHETVDDFPGEDSVVAFLAKMRQKLFPQE